MRIHQLHRLPLLGLLAACAGYPPPNEPLARSMAAARGAEEAGASEVPEAALPLKLAQDQINQARQMMQEGKNERAAFLTMRAYNDAELALAIAREQAARRRAQQAALSARSREGELTPQQ